MNAQHTPGPWILNKTDACIWPSAGRRAHICEVFAAIDPLGELSPAADSFSAEENSNARLIAAAPDLLEALKASVESLEWVILVMPDIPRGSNFMQGLAEAKAAIAKAEVRSN